MNTGVVDGYADVECWKCGGNRWKVSVEHSYDGPAVRLECAIDGDWLRIDISQKMEIM